MFMNEAFEQSVGTQRADMGMFKRFALNLTTVALPNLIANDLVIVYPMASMAGYVNYIRYSYASNKGQTKIGDRISDPFGFGDVDEKFSSNRVVENVRKPDGGDTAFFMWQPVFAPKDAEDKHPTIKVTDVDGTALVEGTDYEVVVDDVRNNVRVGIKFLGDATEVKVGYMYDNSLIPQHDIPTIRAEMDSIALVAKPRRIAIYYSQLAAYQAGKDYDVNLGDQLAEKAVGELSYEIDTEVTNLLIENATHDPELDWSKTLPIGVSKKEHYEGFTEVVEIARQKIYDATKRFAPNYMLCASNLLPVLSMVSGFKAASTGAINGPYMAGTFNGLKVFVTPNIEPGDYVIGVNGNDMMSSAAVYAPYMAIVPTQLLQYADGGTSQGLDNCYNKKIA